MLAVVVRFDDEDDSWLRVGLQGIPEALTDRYLPLANPVDLDSVVFCDDVAASSIRQGDLRLATMLSHPLVPVPGFVVFSGSLEFTGRFLFSR